MLFRSTAEELTGQSGRATLFYIKLHNPDDVHTVIDRIQARQEFATAKLTPVREFASLMLADNQTLVDNFYNVVIFIAVCIGVLVIFLSMYTTITERTREIGILRSLGASKGFIVVLILQESVFLCVLGILIGMGTSLSVGRIIQAFYPTLEVMITSTWVLRAAAFAMLSGIIGSFYPSVKAAAQDPVEALAYE